MIRNHHKITAACMVCLFILWSVRIPLVVKAASDLAGVYTQESIGSVFNDSTLQTKLNSILLTNEQVGTYDVFDTIGEASFDITTDNIVIMTFLSGGGYAIQSFDVPQDVGFIYYDSSTSPRSGYYYCVNDNDDQTVAGRTPITGNLIYSENLDENTISREMVAFYPWGSGQEGQLTVDGCLLYSPIPVYSKAEAIENGAPSSTSGSDNIYLWMLNNADTLTDIRGAGAVWDGENIVVPSDGDVVIEGIENHLFAENFDVFFCQEKSFINYSVGFSSVGGGYVCLKYDLDDYAKTHLDELTLDIDFKVQLDNIIYLGGYEGPVNSSGYTFVPFNKLFSVAPDWALIHNFLLPCSENTFYQNYVYEKIYSIDDSVYNAIVQYSLDPDYDPSRYPDENSWLNAMRFVANVLTNYPAGYYAASQGASGLVSLSRLLNSNLNIALSEYDVAYFHASGCLRDGNGHSSGLFAKKIDFKNGVDSVINNGIGVNENPFDDSFPIIDNGDLVPSSGSIGGFGNVIQNVAFPDRVSILDESYFKVAELYSQDAATVQNGFWAMLGYYADNPMVDTYGKVFGLFPEEFLTYIEACLGICFGFAVFRTLRRR